VTPVAPSQDAADDTDTGGVADAPAAAPRGRRIPTKALLWAALAGVAAVVATLAVATRLNSSEPDYEASVVLDEPGIFQEPGTTNPDTSGTPLPDVTFLDTAGAERTLAEFIGTPLVVNLWYVNCPPCARELGEFAMVHTEMESAGAAVRFIGLDPMDSVERMTGFAAERGVTYDLWRDTGRVFGVLIGAVNYPVTLYVDAAGNVVRQTGETTATEIRANLAELFAITP